MGEPVPADDLPGNSGVAVPEDDLFTSKPTRYTQSWGDVGKAWERLGGLAGTGAATGLLEIPAAAARGAVAMNDPMGTAFPQEGSSPSWLDPRTWAGATRNWVKPPENPIEQGAYNIGEGAGRVAPAFLTGGLAGALGSSELGEAARTGVQAAGGSETAANVADFAALMAPTAGGMVRSAMAGREPPIQQGHPLSAAAESEAANLKSARDAAEKYGIDLPPRETSKPQQYVNDAARTDLKLPGNAPVTPGLIESGIKQYASPAYNAAKAVPAYALSPKYEAAIKGIDLSKLDSNLQPPPNGTMTGAQAVELSQNLRHEARGWFDYAESSGGPPARKTAQEYVKAYKAVEGGFKEAAPDVGAQWDEARTYVAKAKTWEESLDGAGNAAGPKISKAAARGDPVSGPMKEAASVVAQYPELFRSTRLQTPPETMTQKAVRTLTPMAGAAIGSHFGPIGAAIGEGIGKSAATKITGR